MSVDVFGRHLNKIQGTPGPAGIGYKFTDNGQYDIDNKRLCNVAAPNELTDAVNLTTLHRIVRAEIDSVLDIIKKIKSDIQDLDVIVENHRDEIDEKLNKHDINIQEIKKLINENYSFSP